MAALVPREQAPTLHQKLARFPIVTIFGPRQCGKTTFVKAALPDWRYLDLERPSDMVPLREDPELRLEQLGSAVILDEAQRLPPLFEVLRGHVDRHRAVRGQLVLLGSASPSLVAEISESLAGRTGFIEMTPLCWRELAAHDPSHRLGTCWFRGGFPDAVLEPDDGARLDWFDAFTRTFIERDLAALGVGIAAPRMRRLWTMLAHCSGGVWNASRLAGSLGTSYHTVNRYTDILEQSFVVRKLPPYFANVGKRLIKSPKIYLRDSGLLHYFLGIHQRRALETHPSRGASWEGFVIEQIISAFHLRVPGTQAFYWRTAAGAEVDLLLTVGTRLLPIEIKLSSAPRKSDVRGLSACMRDLGVARGFVVYPGKQDYRLGNAIRVLPAERVAREPEMLLEA